TADWQDADGRRRAAAEQLRAAERRFVEMQVPDPTEAAVEAARDAMLRLRNEAEALAPQLDALRTTEGRHEAEQAQAAHDCRATEEKVGVQRREATPALQRWDRLRATVAEHGLLTSVLSPGKGEADGVRGHVNLVQEAHKQRA